MIWLSLCSCDTSDAHSSHVPFICFILVINAFLFSTSNLTLFNCCVSCAADRLDYALNILEEIEDDEIEQDIAVDFTNEILTIIVKIINDFPIKKVIPTLLSFIFIG